MDRAAYRSLVEQLALPLSAWPHFAAIARTSGVSFDTVFSIYSQEVQNRVLRTNHVVKAGIESHAQRYLAGMDALQLAFELDFPPCVLVRRLLEALQLGLAKERITRVLRDPGQLPTLVSPDALEKLAGAAAAAVAMPGSSAAGADNCEAAAGQIQQEQQQQQQQQQKPGESFLDQAAALPEQCRRLLERLQRDVEACVLCDRIYSPASDAARHSAGAEYEERLNAALAAAGVAFWTEGQLRSRGYHKTPDARLQVPIAVQGRIVNWIDSKATFGDDKLHRQQQQEQYERYVNRFGPGLVIYWHGFIADLNRDENVLLMDRFPRPDEILQLPCLPVLPAAAPLAAPLTPAAAGAGQAAAAGAVAAVPSGGAVAAAAEADNAHTEAAAAALAVASATETAAAEPIGVPTQLPPGVQCTPLRPVAPSCSLDSTPVNRR
ncbi:hypothetical protein ABPG77_010376 [Micractinium sp. CCAP 211/92]